MVKILEVKKVIRTENTLFKNSQCLFVEYSDILKTPFFLLLRAIQSSSVCKKIFDLSAIEHLDFGRLYLWYLSRKHFNPYREFPVIGEVENFDDNFFDYIIKAHLESSELFYSENTELLFSSILKDTLQENDSNLIKRVIVYDEFGGKFFEEDVAKLYPSSRIRVECRTGDFLSAIQNLPQDSTYVLSDIHRILDLKQMGKLDYSSILIPYDYQYNYNPSGKSYTIDLEELQKTNTFKINLFRNSILIKKEK